ncbi:putative outer membrane protein OmpH [Candidatus Protochlamydia naegleriophila]|uniref:Putative outer membrane protein OmpH n=1 Tax=Candidatus Protochlamydia naegleriophila TaxID=389348 RepID=A0A0U5JDQ5_9BACT|nr:OmpH family outer membrane protein [Candidatus Protochlamydia naegleriophila]CUI16527.1 putative outer membrane protein OmpH [Candidatus Protochlamydia naegleriophila]
MKNLRHLLLAVAACACALTAPAFAQQASYSSAAGQSLKIGVVNAKRCLDESKLGKQEQANFEKMKKQMESILQDKEHDLEEIEAKLNDEDYMDSISEEAALELKRKKRNLRNEGLQLQNQYIQTLQQTNLKIVQKLTDTIAKASNQVAQDSSSGQTIDVIFSDEACTYFAPQLDITDRVVAKMNAIFDVESKDSAKR